jgi:hypothetical protein
VRYHEAHVWRILRQLGWSCQRPTGRALERDEEAIRYWKRVRWPRLKKKRAASGAPALEAMMQSIIIVRDSKSIGLIRID